jgi:7-keto-8-aminopelargonate synthetase-like enzyme
MGKKMKKNNYTLAFSHNNRDFQDPQGFDLLARTEPFYEWQNACFNLGLWAYGNRALHGAPKQTTSICDGLGVLTENAINLGSQDYLSLATNERIKEAAIATIREYGVHSAGSAAVMGNTDISLRLESALADFLKMEHVTLYPTGWAAGYGAIRGLVRDHDYIVMDQLSHNCLKEGAAAATKKISNFKHLDVESAAKLLARIRKQDTKNGILLITESLFSMDSDTPDIAKFQEICDEYQATLLVDVAHDLGAMGKGGTGALGIQNMLGKVDIVMGSFSKTFASNGGFVATRSPTVKQFLKTFSTSHVFSNALSPAQAATVLEALNIVISPLGESLRIKLMDNIVSLREGLQINNLKVMGMPSPIVPVLVANNQSESKARLVLRQLPNLGLLANVIGFPAVPLGLARVRLQVMAEHNQDMMRLAADKLAQAIFLAEGELNDII